MKFNKFDGEVSVLQRTYTFVFEDDCLQLQGITGPEAARVVELLDVCNEALGDLSDQGYGEPAEEQKPHEDPQKPPTEEIGAKIPPVGDEYDGMKVIESHIGSKLSTLKLENGSWVTLDSVTGNETRRSEPDPAADDDPEPDPEPEATSEPQKRGKSGQKSSRRFVLAKKVTKFFTDNPDIGVTVSQLIKLGGFEEGDESTLRALLSRQTAEGFLMRPKRGVYSRARPELTATEPEPTPKPDEGKPEPPEPTLATALAQGNNDAEASTVVATSTDNEPELPQEIREARDLFPVLKYFRDQGVVDEDEIVQECAKNRAQISCLSNVSDTDDLNDRVRRALEILG